MIARRAARAGLARASPSSSPFPSSPASRQGSLAILTPERRINAARAVPAVHARLAAADVDAVTDSTPQTTAAFITLEFNTYCEVAQRADLRPAT